MIAPLPIPGHNYSGAPGDNSGELLNACLTELDGRVTAVETGGGGVQLIDNDGAVILDNNGDPVTI